MSFETGILPPEFNLEYLENEHDADAGFEQMHFGHHLPSFTEDQVVAHRFEQNGTPHAFLNSNSDIVNCQTATGIQNMQKSTPDVVNKVSDVFVTPTTKTPKSRQMFSSVPSSSLNSATRNLSQHLNSDTTPTKPMNGLDPLTPTANLKMLISAASPEIRNRENKKKELFRQETDDSLCEDSLEISEIDEDLECPQPTSRKDKSLGLLCLKFMSRFPEHPPLNQGIDVSLDEIARELNVERRRIYDIVNVLESVEMVSRMAKNKYLWHGKTNLMHTLARLKALGEAQNVGHQLEQVKEYEMSKELELEGYQQTMKKVDLTCNLMTTLTQGNTVRKERSLGIMSQKFLMLFLVSKPKTINLDLAAKILIGEANVDKTESAKYKTKIRRLYDIANILTSLKLIHKVHVTEVRGRKPAFQYIGPEVESVTDLDVCSSDGVHRPSSKHSLLDCTQNPKLCTILTKNNDQKPEELTSTTPPVVHETRFRVSALKKEAKKSKLTRHASFETICQVAEEEREKLYCSQPSSPHSSQGSVTSESSDTGVSTGKPNAKDSIKKGGQFLIIGDGRQMQVLNGPKAGTKVIRVPVNRVTLTPVSQLSVDQNKTVDDGKTVTSKPLKIATLLQLSASTAKEASPFKVSSPEAEKNEKSLSGGVRRSKRSAQKMLNGDFEYEAPCKKFNSTKADVDEQVSNNSSPQPDKDSPVRHGQEISNTNQSSIVKTTESNKPRPSPLRALHLDPEFRSSPPFSSLPSNTPSPDIESRIEAKDYDLASPLPSDNTESSNHSESHQCTKKQHLAPNNINVQPRPVGQPWTTAPLQYSHFRFPGMSTMHNMPSNNMVFHQVGAMGSFGNVTLTPVGHRQQRSNSVSPQGAAQLMVQTENVSPHPSPPLLTPNLSANLDNSSASNLSFEFPMPQLARINCSPDLNVFKPSINQVPLTMISPQQVSMGQFQVGKPTFRTPQGNMVPVGLAPAFSTPVSRTPMQNVSFNQFNVTPSSYFRNTPGFIPMTSTTSTRPHENENFQMTNAAAPAFENIARRLSMQNGFHLQ